VMLPIRADGTSGGVAGEVSAPAAPRLQASTLPLNPTGTELPEWNLINECELKLGGEQHASRPNNKSSEGKTSQLLTRVTCS
jgi:hypothetical protein